MSGSEFKLPAFVDAIADGVYGVSPEGDCLFVNASAVRMLGWNSAEQLLGRNMHDLIHHTKVDGDAYPRAECPLLQTAQGGAAVRLENELLWRRDGTSFFAEYSAYPVRSDGKVVGSVITFAESQVRQDARLRLSVQHAVSHLLATPNPEALEATMRSVMGIVGGGFGWELGLFWRRQAEEDAAVLARWQAAGTPDIDGFAPVGLTAQVDGAGMAVRVLATGKPVHWSDLPSDDPWLLGATQHGLASGFAFPLLAGGEMLGAVAFFSRAGIEVDDTLREVVTVIGRMVGQALERRDGVANLVRSEARFRTIVNTIPQLAWMTGPDGSISWYNDRWYAYTGTTPEQMAGWGWMSVHHPDHVDRVVRTIGAAFASGESWEDTFPLRAADGSFRWFLSRAVPIRAEPDGSGPGGILGWFGSNTDITAIRQAEQSQAEALDEAEAANQAKSLFLANMSHELRTPLSAIIGYAEMLAEEVEDGADAEELVRDVGKIEANARHLLGLINDVLDLSKVESGKMEAFAETFDVAGMVQDVATTVSSLIEKKHNRLALDLGDALGTMHSDVTRIRQVLLNLLSNAAKFTESGTITLSARREDDWLRFSVRDTGLGMTEEQVAKLFQRFQQADASTTRRFGGTGLGLSLARAFCELLGGTVSVRSRPGEGSTFSVRLPAVLEAPAPPLPEAVDADRQAVLVIDDDATQRELITRFLDRAGYAVLAAADGATGLAMARAQTPHAILLDVTMPGMDGWSVLTTLKSEPALADIPVVMVTLHDERALASSLGAADYIQKPIDWSRLGIVLDRFRPTDGDVLVIDDDAETRQRLRHALERTGWSVSEAADGQEALARIADSAPRLVLLDLSMPVMDGFDFLRRLREQPGCSTVPVIVLTAMDLSLDDRRRLRGANQVLNKGTISVNELTDTLRGLTALSTGQPAAL